MKRESWSSRLGFILAVSGSAIGLANIWRFPYLVGEYGGAGFVLVYLFSLAVIGFPVLIAEIVLGRKSRKGPAGAFKELGKSKAWGWVGKLTVLTGFIVSSFYSAIAGWILGYLVESVKGNITNFSTTGDAVAYFEVLLASPLFTFGAHTLFVAASTMILFFGVRHGIERGNKILMPILMALLLFLLGYGLTLENATDAFQFLWKPNLSALSWGAILAALGQSFFTLSLGQGTMVTYGSYVKKEENLILSCLPIVLMDTLVSIISATIVFSIVFSVGLAPNSGPGLIFHTLPVVFSKIPFGNLLAPLFFLLTTLAALTSEISAMEPSIAYLIDEWEIPRKKAASIIGLLVFLVGAPSALSTNLMKEYQFFGATFFEGMEFLCSNILIPLGGLAATILAGWVFGSKKTVNELKEGSGRLFDKWPSLATYFSFCFKYLAPILILIVLVNQLL